jgi:hypothetical protein
MCLCPAKVTGVLKHRTGQSTMDPSPLRVSTMTATGQLGVTPNLQRLYTHCYFIPYAWIGEGIIKIEYGAEKKGQSTDDILHTTNKKKKHFFNQSSVVFRLRLPEGTFKETNIKLFKNGSFQITGISSEEMGRAAVTRLIELNTADPHRAIWSAQPKIQTFTIFMMNSDYKIGKAVRRDKLYKVLVEEYGLQSSFEPTIYQGVNTKFFWNKCRPANAPPGICICPTPCTGNGTGYSVGSCIQLTIAPFRTGSVIINSAQSLEQLMDAYTFINSVFKEHEDDVLRDEPQLEQPVRKKVAPVLNSPEAIIRQKMRASPKNIVRLTAVTT